MVEILALALTKATQLLWRHLLGRVVAMLLWGAYGLLLPQGLRWADEVLPGAVNLSLPFAGVLLATAEAVRHWRHKHHHHDQETDSETPGQDGVSDCLTPSDTG